MEHLSNDQKDCHNQYENSQKQYNETGHPILSDGKSMEIETITWSEFPNGGTAIVEQILASVERNQSKRAGLWESQSGIQVGKLTIWVRSFDKNCNRAHQVYQFHQNGLANPYEEH